jgi:(R,R)-butanediol dehydrogenase/meso-butanediol dehydrogenase/diacetyl reductase
MQALQFYDARDIRLEEVDEPEIEVGKVKVEVEWCGICGTDVHEYLAGPIVIPTAENPHPITGEHLPLTMGHEFAGRVAEVGDQVLGFEVGQPVAVEPLIYCHECPACLAGTYNLCARFGAIGLHGWGGAYSRFVVVPPNMVHPLPEGMTTAAGAVAEPIAVGWHATQRANFRLGESALVVGAGPIGLGTQLVLQTAGVGFLAMSVRRTGARSEMAQKFGADAVIDASATDPVAEIKELTGGVGVDVVFETAGTQQSMDTALSAVRRGGRVISLAIWEDTPRIDCNALLADEVTLIGSQAYANEYPAVLKAIADGRIQHVEDMITRRVELANIVADGFEELVENKNDHVKIVVSP